MKKHLISAPIYAPAALLMAWAILCPDSASAAQRKKKTAKTKAQSTQSVTTRAVDATSNADTTQLQQTMTLERDFAPIVRDADKLTAHPAIEEPVLTSRSSISYAAWQAQPSTATDLTRLAVGRVFDVHPFDTHRGYVDLRLGNYWNTDFHAGYRLIDTRRTLLSLSTAWHATTGDIASNHTDLSGEALPDWNSARLQGAGDLRLERHLERLNWSASVGFTGDRYHLLANGLNRYLERDEPTQKTSDLRLAIQIDNQNGESDVTFESGLEGYRYTYDLPYEGTEWTLRWHGTWSSEEWWEDHTVGTYVAIGSTIYDVEKFGYFEGIRSPQDVYSATLKPFVAWEVERLHLHLGVRADLLTKQKNHVGLSPDVHLTYRLGKGQTLFADATGGNEYQTVRHLMREMPFYLPLEQVRNPWTVCDAVAGYSNTVSGNFRAKVYVGARQTFDAVVAYAAEQIDVKRQPLGVATTLGSVDDLQLKVGGAIEFTCSKYLSGTVEAVAYKHSKEEAASQKANVEAQVTLSSRPVKPLLVELKYEGLFDRKAWYLSTAQMQQIDLENGNDLSLSGSWTFANRLAIHADLHNLLNEEQDVWLGVPAQGFHFQVGASWTF
jgi:hypothetical protein